MGIWNKLKDALFEPSINDVGLYEKVAAEIKAGYRRDGLWAKALAECDFNEQKASSIYMKMAVKSLQQEIRYRKQNAMDQAFSLYDKRQYDDAIEGLLLLVELNRNPVAMACLANIAWHGLSKQGVDRSTALALFEKAEKSLDPGARNFLGAVLQPIDWKRSLANYNYAAANGNKEAAENARVLQMRIQGPLSKNAMDKLKAWF